LWFGVALPREGDIDGSKATNKEGELVADPDEESIPTMLCNGRPHFSLGLPPTYLGNMAFRILFRLSLSSLTSSD
jgi:hypothetical protein